MVTRQVLVLVIQVRALTRQHETSEAWRVMTGQGSNGKGVGET